MYHYCAADTERLYSEASKGSAYGSASVQTEERGAFDRDRARVLHSAGAAVADSAAPAAAAPSS